MEANKTDTLVKAEPRIELTHDGRGNDRTIARAASGRFAKKHNASVRKHMRDTIKFLEEKDTESGKPRADVIREKVYENIKKSDPDALVGQIKAAQYLEDSAFSKSAKDKIVEESNPRVGITIVINAPTLMHNELKEDHEVPAPPPFIKAEIVSTNPQKV